MTSHMDKIQFEDRNELDHLLSIIGEAKEKGIIAEDDEVMNRFHNLVLDMWCNW